MANIADDYEIIKLTPKQIVRAQRIIWSLVGLVSIGLLTWMFYLPKTFYSYQENNLTSTQFMLYSMEHTGGTDEAAN